MMENLFYYLNKARCKFVLLSKYVEILFITFYISLQELGIPKCPLSFIPLRLQLVGIVSGDQSKQAISLAQSFPSVKLAC